MIEFTQEEVDNEWAALVELVVSTPEPRCPDCHTEKRISQKTGRSYYARVWCPAHRCQARKGGDRCESGARTVTGLCYLHGCQRRIPALSGHRLVPCGEPTVRVDTSDSWFYLCPRHALVEGLAITGAEQRVKYPRSLLDPLLASHADNEHIIGVLSSMIAPSRRAVRRPKDGGTA